MSPVDPVPPRPPSGPKSKKKRIVALGGGLGTLSALFAITEVPGWQDRYDITLYQIGWRLGGRARSGRNARMHMRSEAFGHHVWWGCYDNAFALLRRCYKELGRPAGAPLATFRESWKPNETLLIGTGTSERHRLWPLTIARNGGTPGEGDPPPSVWDYVQILLPWVLDCLPGLHPDLTSYALLAPRWPEQSRSILPALLRRAAAHGITSFAAFDPKAPDYDALLRATGDHLPQAPLGSRQRRAWAQPLVVCAEHSLRALEAAGARELHPQFIALLDIAMAVVRGIIHDGLDRSPAGFSAADDHDLRAWLRHHGAGAASLQNPVVAGLYDMLLAHDDGDPERPSIAAGAAMRLLLRALLAHRGALYYTPQSDLGEVVFAPLYQVLKRRGVRFRFFHKIKQLRAEGDKITAIRIGRQVELDPGIDDYEPLITIKGVPCWPSRPSYNQIVLGESPLIQALDFESSDSPEIEEITLRHGADFDEVLLGIPAPALPRICGDLVQLQPRWRAALEHAASAPSFGVQMWLTPTWAQLAGNTAPMAAGALPGGILRRWANRSQLAKLENWPRDSRPGAVATLDGPFADAARGDTPASRDQVRDHVATWLKSHPRRLWPEAALSTTDELNWELLLDPSSRTGEHRLAGQHCWSLVTPADRHTLTLPGSTRHRLSPGTSGFDNLSLAGDWLTGGLDLGCAESAVIAGFQAARLLCGHPAVIPGEADTVDTSEDPGASQSLRVPVAATAPPPLPV